MKILFVSIPNHHFFQWANQLKQSGFDVYWFDVTDGAGFSEKIGWVKQFNGWKLKWKYPFRYTIKKQFPKLYSFLEQVTTEKTEIAFERIVTEIKPDIVHCFEMKLAGIPILSTMQRDKIPLLYSSWGSDLFDFQNLGVTISQVKLFLNRVDFLITDCHRDFKIAQNLGYKNTFLGIYPGNGGVEMQSSYSKPISDRKTICIKGYEDGVGKALDVLKAIESLVLDESITFLIFSADASVVDYVQNSTYFRTKKVEIIPRNAFLPNTQLLQKFGSCLLYIGNSTSDGMPNALIEAMGMGVFPIQSNPGKVTEEIVTNGINGFLIENPSDISEISTHILKALQDLNLLENATKYNSKYVLENYNRNECKDKIVSLYNTILQQN